MTKTRRIKEFLIGIVMIAVALLLALDPVHGLKAVAVLLCISLLIGGIRALWFYLSMAKHMVGGKAVLFRGIILLDAGVFTFSIIDKSQLIILVYLIVGHVFAGVVDLMRGLEAKEIGSSSWKYKAGYGVTNLAFCAALIIAFAVSRDNNMLVYVYAAGLFFSALVRMRSSFKRTAIPYIP
ncbi:MAG: hypothetical protein Q4A65_08250 [Bacillota bacterium]|nr:hypothetical protein [Bacillota bacterium]